MEHEQTKKSKNFLGYDADTMASAKSRSRYFVYIASVLMLITVVIGQPVNFADSNWYTTILPEMVGGFIGGILLAMFVAYILRIFTKGTSEKGNNFNYFAMTFLVISALFFITKIFG